MKTHAHCIYSTWTCTITGFPRWTKRNRALLFGKGFLWSFYVVMMQMSFYLMCPSGLWLVLFRWRGCLSTSGPDQSSTWCPIRVVLFCHVCRTEKKRKKAKKKIPLHYGFVIQCVKVFSRCGFRHNSVCVGVWWHGKNENKKRIKHVTILRTPDVSLMSRSIMKLKLTKKNVEESGKNVSFLLLIWIHVRYINKIFQYSGRQIWGRGMKITHSRSPHASLASFSVFSLSFLCLVHRCHCRASAIPISADTVLNLPGCPRCGPGPEWDFCPLSQTPDILPVYPVCFSSGQPAGSWSPVLRGDLWWHRTRATAGPCFPPDVKGAKNQHQICSVVPCMGGARGTF